MVDAYNDWFAFLGCRNFKVTVIDTEIKMKLHIAVLIAAVLLLTMTDIGWVYQALAIIMAIIIDTIILTVAREVWRRWLIRRKRANNINTELSDDAAIEHLKDKLTSLKSSVTRPS